MAASTPALAQSPRPTFKDVERADLPLTRRAYDLFARTCPGLAKIAPLVEHVDVRDQAVVLHEDGQRRGWTVAVSVEVQLRRQAVANLQEMGTFVAPVSIALLGAGREPGIIADTRMVRQLCNAGEADFIPVPELRFLTRWPSLVADEKAHPNRRLDSTARSLSADPPTAR